MPSGGDALGINFPFARLAAQKLNRPRAIVQRLRQWAGLGEPIIARGHRNAARVESANHVGTEPPLVAHAEPAAVEKHVQRPRPLRRAPGKNPADAVRARRRPHPQTWARGRWAAPANFCRASPARPAFPAAKVWGKRSRPQAPRSRWLEKAKSIYENSRGHLVRPIPDWQAQPASANSRA